MSDRRGVRLGWWLSSEEHDPRELVEQARVAEAIGFSTTMVSDHLQPWVRHTANTSFVWTALGAIAQATETIEVGTGVTAMVQRMNPIVVAHAAATAGVMFEGRFFLGVGTGERLNEQPFGGRWSRTGERRDQLRESIDIIRRLWSGATVNHQGKFWTGRGPRRGARGNPQRSCAPPTLHRSSVRSTASSRQATTRSTFIRSDPTSSGWPMPPSQSCSPTIQRCDDRRGAGADRRPSHRREPNRWTPGVGLALVRRWRAMAFNPVALLIEVSTFGAVNYLVRRPRPDVDTVGSVPSTFGFPSGHVAATLVCWLGLALLLATRAPRWATSLVAAFGVAAVIAMGWARCISRRPHSALRRELTQVPSACIPWRS